MTRIPMRPAVWLLSAALLACVPSVSAQSATSQAQSASPGPQATPEPKPLTNADIITMIKKALPETTVIAAMRANPIAFDVSMDGLLALKDAGVSAKVMDAMVAAVERKRNSTRTTTTTTTPTTPVVRRSGGAPPPPASSSQPTVLLVDGDSKRPLPIDKTRLMQAKQKPASLGSIAKDNAIDQALRVGLAEVSQLIGGGVAGGMVGTGGGVARGAMESKSKTVGYIFALPGTGSATILPSTAPAFEVSLGRVLGVNPDEYTPAIIVLTPTTKDWRLVGAAEGKEKVSATASLDWPLYSGFVEDRVPVDIAKLENGGWRISPTRALVPGEYAVVFRPVSSQKKFRGIDVARNQGDGLMFNSVWAFSIR